MIAGLCLPGRPVGNMYFSAFSHNVITTSVNLSADLKMGEYRKSLTQRVDRGQGTKTAIQ